MALHLCPDLPVKTHNALCCKDRIDDNTAKLFKMGQTLVQVVSIPRTS